METEIKLEEVWFFIWTRTFLVKLSILSVFQIVSKSYLQNNLRKKHTVVGCYKPPSLNDEYFYKLYGALSLYNIADCWVILISPRKTNVFRILQFFFFRTSYQNNNLLYGTNPSFIDHVITNMPSFFIKSYTVEMGISDHHKPVMSTCRTTFDKGESKKFLIVVIILLIVSILRKLW